MTVYFFKNKKVALGMRLIDKFLALFAKKKPAPLVFPQKILLSNIAHLGDLIMATAVLPVLKEAFPKAKIGFVIGSWNREVFQNYPMVDKVYFFDHIKINRTEKNLFKKIWRHWITRYRTLKSLRLEQYDVAIDLYYYFPNAIFLFWQARIPCRIGYSSAGLGPLLTTSLDYLEIDQHVSKYYIPLLQELRVSPKALQVLQPYLPCKEMPCLGYVILHMGVGDPLREWSEWRELIEYFCRDGVKLVFTGRGEREKAKIKELRPSLGVDVCDKLSFHELVLCVKQAALVIASDTGIIHIASALQVPSIVLFPKYINHLQRIQDEKITKKMALSDSAEMVYKKAHESLNY